METSSGAALLFTKELKLNLSLDSLEDCDSVSLSEERRYQSELQDHIYNNEETFCPAREIQHGSTHDFASYTQPGHKKSIDSDLKDYRARLEPYYTSFHPLEMQYSELRYDPEWRRKQTYQSEFPQDDDEEELVESPKYSDLLTPDITHRANTQDSSTVREQNIILASHQKPQPDIQSKDRKNTPTKHTHSLNASDNTKRPLLHQNMGTTDQMTVTEKCDATKRDIVEKNRATLGVRTQKNSYLHLHKKKADESSLDQNRMPATNETLPGTEVKDNNLLKVVSADKTKFTDGHNKELSLKPTRVGGLLSVGSLPILNTVGFSSEHPRYESSNKYFISWNEKPQELTSNRNLGSTRNTLDIHCGLSQETAAIPPTYNLNNYDFLADDNKPLNVVPKKTSIDSSNLTTTEHHKTKPSEREKNSGESWSGHQKGHRMEESNQKVLISYLKQEVKLGGMGPSHTVSQEKKEQLRQQKEYAKFIQERNKNKPMKAQEMTVVQNDSNKGTRKKSLEYAKNIPRPQPQPKTSAEKKEVISEERAITSGSYDNLFPNNKLLEDLKARHKQERMAVAAISALHIL
ncbi:jhy protein homolog [Hyperolius riggenbachi]|uniref:jhy protein homolog n=1 Tax=Hyperolius riggenbachi TaxID=752182 RepID=UPI0035A2A81A